MDLYGILLVGIAIFVLGVSVNFFILGTTGIVPFLEYRNYILVPSFFVILFIGMYGYKKNKRLTNRLVTGLLIGIVATFALEAVRIPSIYFHWIPHDDMIALPGKLLTNPPSINSFDAMVNQKTNIAEPMKTGSVSNTHSSSTAKHDDKNAMGDKMIVKDSKKPTASSGEQQESIKLASTSENKNINNIRNNSHIDTTKMMMNDSMQAPTSLELIVGGLYHFWNGGTMAAAYTLVIGKGRWYYGLAWGFIIHIGMMLAPWMIPMVGPFGINYSPGYTIFIASLLAHLAYGGVIGILVQRFVKDKQTLINIVRSRETRLLQ